MFDWWNVISSLTRVNDWAQILSVVFLALSVSSFFLTLKISLRIAVLKSQGPEEVVAQAPMPPQPPSPKPVAQGAPAPAPAPAAPATAKPAPAKPAPEPAKPAPAKPVPEPAKTAPAIPAPEPAKTAPGPAISAAQKSRLLTLLLGRPKGKVKITNIKGDGNSQAYAAELARILSAAGWEAVWLGPKPDFPDATGLFFMIKSPGSEPENSKYLIHSFIEAGLKPNTVLDKSVQENTLLLVVGHR